LGVGTPRLLFETASRTSFPFTSHDTLDGRRFLMVEEDELPPQPATEIILDRNWFEVLKHLCPTGK